MTSGPCGVAQGKDGDGVFGGASDGLTTVGTPESDEAPVTHCDIGIEYNWRCVPGHCDFVPGDCLN